MAQRSSSDINIDSLNQSQSNLSVISGGTTDSTRSSSYSLYSTTSSQRRRGILGKLGNGFQSMFRRFTRQHRNLTEMQIRILVTNTDYDREEVIQWHEKFLSDYPNGYMSRKQFILVYKSLCPKADADRFVRHVFRAFDVDRSNTVDFHEFLVGLSMTAPVSSLRTKLEWIFHVFDIDGNGVLTKRECLEVLESIVRFNLSLQGDNLNPNYDQLLYSAKKSMMKIFDNMTDSRAEGLTMEQFIKGCTEDDFLSQLLAPGATTTLVNSQNTCDSP